MNHDNIFYSRGIEKQIWRIPVYKICLGGAENLVETSNKLWQIHHSQETRRISFS